MYKQNNGNVSVKFTNYTKQGSSSNQSLLDGEPEEVSMALTPSFDLDDMKQLLDKEFERLSVYIFQNSRKVAWQKLLFLCYFQRNPSWYKS